MKIYVIILILMFVCNLGISQENEYDYNNEPSESIDTQEQNNEQPYYDEYNDNQHSQEEQIEQIEPTDQYNQDSENEAY